jgi:subtilisin family serine protease
MKWELVDMTHWSLIVLLLLPLSVGAQQGKVPDDPWFESQVSFHNDGGRYEIDRFSYRASKEVFDIEQGIHLNILRAWEVSTGSKDVVVALLDDGFDYLHEDLTDNIWRNPGESGLDANGLSKATNGVDDDGNGYVDDVIGWDFAFDDPDPDHYIFDGRDQTRVQPYTHSTPALGIIGAKGDNGVGIAGINWDVSMMLLKIGAQGGGLSNTGGIRVMRAAEAIRYAVENGARVINWSGFVPETEEEDIAPLRAAVDYAEARGVLLVTAAGNGAKDNDLAENKSYPRYFENENLISVAEVDFDGGLYVASGIYVGGSNYGRESVDIAALAQNFSTHTYHNNSVYRLAGGTSSSAPVVTGVVALIMSVNPDLTGLEVKDIIMRTAQRLPALRGKVKSEGMVDAYGAVEMALNTRRR